METAYTFDDVMFVPQHSNIQSRSEVALTSSIGKVDLTLPIISANMEDITEAKMAYEIHQYGGLGILHRFMSIEENVEMFQETVNALAYGAPWGSDNLRGDISLKDAAKYVGVSIGVGPKAEERFQALYNAGAKTFCIDVAHGHHLNVGRMVHFIKENYKYIDGEITIIAGNVASAKGARFLADLGADVIKVGVGPGSCCQTRENTGVGVPQLYVLEQVRKELGWNTDIIADGGIKKTGDIAKALKYADAVMMGGFFSGTTETPGHVFETMDGEFYKTMAGSASAEGKTKNGQEKTFVEGGIRQVPFRGHVKYIFKKIKENVQSSFSYSGARNIREFRLKSEFIRISGGGKKESKL